MEINSLIQDLAILAPPFLFALTIHELAHGYLALRLGDPTASRLGRLTLNPLKHIDLFGALAFLIMKIGWAKPIPVNPAYFRNPQRDLLWVSLAGPGANLLLAIASTVLMKLLAACTPFLPHFFLWPALQMLAASIWINLVLAFFNLLPIPPLDGSKVLLGLFPTRLAVPMARIEPFGFLILLVLFYSGSIQKLLLPLISFTQRVIAG